MVTVAITLPEDTLIFAEAQAAAKGLAGLSEYFQGLIAAAQRELEQADLEARFASAVRAIEQGEPNPLSPEDWRRLRERALSRQLPAT